MVAFAAPLPERLGAYRLLFRLPSRDGTDEYAALEEGPLGFQREVLLKLAPYRGGQSQAARDLAREAAAVAALNHPGLVRMYEFFEYEGRLVLVLERGEHIGLGRLLAHCRRQKRPLEDDAIFHVAHRVAAALAHAHGREATGGEPAPVVHRALGPSAVLFGWDGSVRLAGFGFAKILSAAAETTQLNIARGVPGYMAPEQLNGDKVTERADVYQLGLLVWEMLANRSPGLSPWAGGLNGAEGDPFARPGPVALLRPTVPPEIVAALEAALEPDAERRTLRAADLERWLARTVDVEAGRDVLCRRLAALRGPKHRRRLEALRSRCRRLRRGSRRWAPEDAPETLASFEALALSTLAPPPPPPAFRPRHAGPAAALAAPRPVGLGVVLPSPLAEGAGAFSHPSGAPRGEAFTSEANAPLEAVSTDAGARASGDAGPRARRVGWRWPVLLVSLTGVALGLSAVGALFLRDRGAQAGAERVAGLASSAAALASVDRPAAPEEAPLPMPRGYGSIVVHAPLTGYVYINGVPYGPSDRPVFSPCGRRHVRVGAAPEPRKRTVWLTGGVWATVACGESTDVTLPGSKLLPRFARSLGPAAVSCRHSFRAVCRRSLGARTACAKGCDASALTSVGSSRRLYAPRATAGEGGGRGTPGLGPTNGQIVLREAGVRFAPGQTRGKGLANRSGGWA